MSLMVLDMPIIKRKEEGKGPSRLEAMLMEMANSSLVVEGKPTLQPCPVYFRDLEGKDHNFLGVNYLEAVVQSPLVEEGSGQLLCHPESTRTLVVLTKEKVAIPATYLGEAGVKAKLMINGHPYEGGEWEDTLVSYGTPVVGLKYQAKTKKGPKTKVRPLIKWNELMPGLVRKVSLKWDQETTMMAVEVELHMVIVGDNEKYRGFGKARGNGGFLRNIKVTTEQGRGVFDPKSPLKDEEGDYVQVEHVVGPEEYKVLNYLIGMVAHHLQKVVWNSLTGKWEGYTHEGEKLGENEIETLIAQKAKKVTVQRDWLNPKVYSMFKTLYGEGGKWEDPNFSFIDSTFTVIHKNAPCWVGLQTQIIECPLTLSFTGRTSLFAEHIGYLGCEYPHLFGILMQSVKENSTHIDGLVKMALGEIPGETEDNPFGDTLVLSTNESQIIEGEKWGLTIYSDVEFLGEEDPEWKTKLCKELTIPEESELDTDFLRRVGKVLKKAGIPALCFYDELGEALVFIEIEGFLRVTGSVSHKAFKTFSQLFSQFLLPIEDRDEPWQKEVYRLIKMLQGALEFLVADSDSLLTKASKTESVMLTARRMGTNDSSVMENEIHAHPAYLEYVGIKPHAALEEGPNGQIKTLLEDGDYAVNGRVPMPGASTQKWVSNSRVPFGVVLQQSWVVKAQDQGDHDGDSGLAIVLDKDGNLKPIKGIQVNPIAS